MFVENICTDRQKEKINEKKRNCERKCRRYVQIKHKDRERTVKLKLVFISKNESLRTYEKIKERKKIKTRRKNEKERQM